MRTLNLVMALVLAYALGFMHRETSAAFQEANAMIRSLAESIRHRA